MGKHVEYISKHKPSKLIRGSGFAGYLECTYDHLVALFGEPTIPTDGYKTSAEWHVEIHHDGEVKGAVAIYDYKEHVGYSEDGLETQHITSWHVGSKNNWLAADLINFVTHAHVQHV